MKKLLIFTNHTLPANTGGCEIIVDNIACNFSHRGVDVCVYGSDVQTEMSYNNYAVKKFSDQTSVSEACLQLNKDDCILVYSDSCFAWPHIINLIDVLPCRVVLCTVGFYYSSKHPVVLRKIKNNKDKIKIVVHSSLHPEVKYLSSMGVPYSIIPNAVDLKEFEKTICVEANVFKIITIANCYPNKGHPQCIEALKLIHEKGIEFEWDVFCTTSTVPVARNMTRILKQSMDVLPFKATMNLDSSRSYLIECLKSSTLLIHGSVSEVAPVVILEAMAARCPWVCFDVGNVRELCGGLVAKDPDKNIVDLSTQAEKLLMDYELRQNLKIDGYNLIQTKFCWEKVIEEYNKICFTNE